MKYHDNATLLVFTRRTRHLTEFDALLMLNRAYGQRISAQDVIFTFRRATCARFYPPPLSVSQRQGYSTRRSQSKSAAPQAEYNAPAPGDRLDVQLCESLLANDVLPETPIATDDPTSNTTIHPKHTTPAPILRPPPPSPSQPHHSLTTFLTHAARTSLSLTSTTYLGTRYEYLVQTHLSSNFHFNLTRIGGRGDSGIDLLGTWDLPRIISLQQQSSSQPEPPTVAPDKEDKAQEAEIHHPNPIPVLIQCKRLRLSSRSGPNLIRELEGSFRSAPLGWRRDNLTTTTTSNNNSTSHTAPTFGTLGILVCTQPATKGIRDAMARSTRGLMWWFVEEVDHHHHHRFPSVSAADRMSPPSNTTDSDEHTNADADDHEAQQQQPRHLPTLYTRQILWNHAASVHCGLQGVDVGTRYIPRRVEESESTAKTKGDIVDEKEAVLLWNGRPFGGVS